MKISHVHPSAVGLGYGLELDREGFAEFHASDQYARATLDQLYAWSEHDDHRIRNAALIEIHNREIFN